MVDALRYENAILSERLAAAERQTAALMEKAERIEVALATGIPVNRQALRN